jgi:hypothetical protein
MPTSSDEHRRLLSEALARADGDIAELQLRVAEGERVAAELAKVQRELAVCRADCAQLQVDLAATAPIRLAAARARALRGGA